MLQRQSLVTQAAAAIQQEIAAGNWTTWLPTERDLCAHFQVSRCTIRLALHALKENGTLVSKRGAGTRVMRPGFNPAQRSGDAPLPRSVGVLLIEPLAKMRPYFFLWMEEVKSLLQEAGISTHFYSGRHYFVRNNAAVLEKLVNRYHHGCWIAGPQEGHAGDWFRARGITWIETHRKPGVLAVCADGNALARHAAGRMLSHGHVHLGIIVQTSGESGPLPLAADFVAAATEAKTTRGPVRADIIEVPENIDRAAGRIRQIFRASVRPTAILVGNPLHYLTVHSILAELGLRVPADVSLVSTFGDPFLPYMRPEPTRYQNHTGQLAKKLAELCIAALDGASLPRKNHSVIPDFIRGASLAPPAARS